MVTTIPNLFPTPAPPATPSSPSPSEKVPSVGESSPFEKALERASKNNQPKSKSEAAEKPRRKDDFDRDLDRVPKDEERDNQTADMAPVAASQTAQTAASEPAATPPVENSATAQVAPTGSAPATPTAPVDPAGLTIATETLRAAEAPVQAAAPAPTVESAPATPAPVTEAPVVTEPAAAVPAEAEAQAPVLTTSEAPAPAVESAESPVQTTAETPAEAPEATPVQVTVRQAGTGMKDSLKLEGQIQPDGEAGGAESVQAATGTTSPSTGVAHGVHGESPIGHNPIQANEPDRVAGARTAEIIRQVSDQLEGLAKNPRATLHIQLQPEELGRINLRLTTNANGLRVTMFADQPLTREMLENNLGNLRSALAEAGVNLSSLNVSQDNHPGQGYASWRSPDKASHTAKHSFTAPEPVDVVPATTLRTSAIDYRV